MCMNIDATFAVTKRWEEEEQLHCRSPNRSKIIRQRQLGLLRGSHSADVFTRRIKTADDVSCHESLRDRFNTNGRENRHPVDKSGPSLLSREKLRMLRQIRAENAEALSKTLEKQQNHTPTSSGPHSTDYQDNFMMGSQRNMNKSQHHRQESTINELQQTLQIKAGDDEPTKRNILHELRDRSKYLPALMKEFKKLEVKCPGDDFHAGSNRPQLINSIGVKNAVPDITCATILAAIRTTRENQGTKRAVSAPSVSKPSPGTISRKPPTRSQKSFQYSPTTSGVILAPGVNAVYSHIPTPPRKKFHNPLTTSYPSPSNTSNDNPSRKVISHHCVKRGRSPAGRIWSAGTISQSLTIGETSKSENILSCKHMCLNRSKSASQLEQINEHHRQPSSDRFESTRMRLPSKPRFESKKRNRPNRMVRFSEEEDKVFEYTRDELMTTPLKADDSVFVYTTTANLRKCLDEKLGPRPSR